MKYFLTRPVGRPQTSRAFSTRRLSAENRRKILEDRTHRHVEERLVNRFNMCCVCTHFFTGIPPSAVCCRVSLVYLCRTEQIHASHTHVRICTHTHTHTRTHTCTNAHTHTRTHARTHTHAHYDCIVKSAIQIILN